MKEKQYNKIQMVIIQTPRGALIVFLLLIMIVVLFPMVFGGLKSCQTSIEDNMPSADKAPWVIQTYLYTDGAKTPSRYYLGEVYATIDGVPTLNGYWTLEGQSFEYHAAMINFPPSEYGPVTIVRRK